MNPIGFKELFNDDLNAGLIQIKATIQEINKALAGTKSEADKFAQAVGSDLKGKIDAITSSSSNLDAELKKVKADFEAFKNATAQTNATIDAYKKTTEDLTQKTKKLEEELKKAKTGVEGVGKAKKSASIDAKQLAQSLIGVGTQTALVYKGIQMLGQQLVKAFKSAMDFEVAIKQVGAISRASAEDLASLTENANRLGATTEKTAVQIASLQKELAKLGFNTTEILASTDAIVDLSTATGEDLTKSAVVASSTLRAFGLDAVEMGRIVDVMAGSFVRSGLDLEKFRESIKLVAPIARAVNVDIETTTAMLSKLADAGLSGSLAGTALRNLLSNMADPLSKLSNRLGFTVENSEDLVRAFKKLRDEGVGLAEAVQLVDVRARPAFFTILNQIDSVEGLSIEYSILNGEAKELANVIRDSLTNDVDIANSAFDALRRNIAERFIPETRTLMQSLATTSEFFRLLINDISQVVEKMDEFSSTEITIETSPLQSLINLFKNLGSAVTDYVESSQKVEGIKTFKKSLENLSNTAKIAVDDIEALNSVTAILEGVKDTASGITFSNIIPLVNALGKEYDDIALAIENGLSLEKATLAVRFRLLKNIEDSNNTYAQAQDRVNAINRELKAMVKVKGDAVKLSTEYLNLQGQASQLENVLYKSMLTRKGIEDAIVKSKNQQNLSEEEALRLEGLKEENIRKAKQKKSEDEKLRKQAIKDLQDQIKLEAELGKAITTAQLAEVEFEKAVFDAQGDTLKALDKYKEGLELRKKVAKEAYETEIRLIKATNDAKEDTSNKEKIALLKFNQEVEKIDNERILKKVKADEGVADLQLKLAQMVTSEIDKMDKEVIKNATEKRNKEIKSIGEKEKEKQEIIKASLQEISKLTSLFFDNAQIKRNNELKRIDVWEKERVRLAGDNQEAIEGIEREAEVKRRAIKKKQAQADKAEAIFQIALNTAVNVVKAGLKPWQVALMIALGVAQTAMVLARPLPEFAKGTDNAPEGNAIVGERGRELIWDKKSNTMRVSPDKASMTYLSKGSIVIPHKETEKILSGRVDPNSVVAEKLGSSTKKDNFSFDYNRLGDSFEKAVTKIPIHQTTFDSNGVREFVKKGNSRTERLNRRYKY
jgi:TP901 family phage tail tape measure protein